MPCVVYGTVVDVLSASRSLGLWWGEAVCSGFWPDEVSTCSCDCTFETCAASLIAFGALSTACETACCRFAVLAAAEIEVDKCVVPVGVDSVSVVLGIASSESVVNCALTATGHDTVLSSCRATGRSSWIDMAMSANSASGMCVAFEPSGCVR